MQTEKTDLLGWCVIELMGRRRLTGYVTPVEIAGAGFLRIDVPAADCRGEQGPWAATQLVSPTSVYCITPTTAELAIRAAGVGSVQPVSRWELPAARQPAPTPTGRVGDYVTDRDDDDRDDDRNDEF